MIIQDLNLIKMSINEYYVMSINHFKRFLQEYIHLICIMQNIWIMHYVKTNYLQ